MENYFDQIMNDVIDILQQKKVSWPRELTHEEKIQLVQSTLEYFTVAEEYEKCVILQKRLLELTNPVKRGRKKKGYDETKDENRN